MNDTLVYRLLRWLNEGRRQTLVRAMLWRMRALSEDRTRLKQRVRSLELDQRRISEERDAAHGRYRQAVVRRAEVEDQLAMRTNERDSCRVTLARTNLDIEAMKSRPNLAHVCYQPPNTPTGGIVVGNGPSAGELRQRRIRRERDDANL